MTGLSASNVVHAAVCRAWPQRSLIGPQAVGQLPWGHVTVPLDKPDDSTARLVRAASGRVLVVAQRPAEPTHRRAGRLGAISTGRLRCPPLALTQHLHRYLSTLVDVGNDIDVPADYLTVLEAIKDDVRTARRRALRVVNTELLELYWRIGRTILDRQVTDGWGAKVISRLSEDLRASL